MSRYSATCEEEFNIIFTHQKPDTQGFDFPWWLHCLLNLGDKVRDIRDFHLLHTEVRREMLWRSNVTETNQVTNPLYGLHASLSYDKRNILFTSKYQTWFIIRKRCPRVSVTTCIEFVHQLRYQKHNQYIKNATKILKLDQFDLITINPLCSLLINQSFIVHKTMGFFFKL